MVLSNISDTVQYDEANKVDKTDKGHVSSLYAIEMHDNTEYLYGVVLGTLRSEFSQKHHIVYYPIYLVNKKDKIKSKIGVFEMDTSEVASIIHDDGDIDVERLGDPLLFSFATREYLDKYGKHIETRDLDSDEEESSKIAETTPEEKAEEPIDDPYEDEDDLFSLRKKDVNDTKKNNEEEENDNLETTTNVKQNEDVITVDTLFEKDKPLPELESWTPETDEEAKKMTEEFKSHPKKNNNWVSAFMRNNHYGINKVKGDGNCLFSCIKEAYDQMGFHTTVEKLRKILSQEITSKQYDNYKEIYDSLLYNSRAAKQEMDKLKEANLSLKKQSEGTKSVKQQETILNEAVKVKQNYFVQDSQNAEADALLQEFDFMETIKDVDEFKRFVQTPEFWADTWAISTLELILSMKLIILEETDDRDSVIVCGQRNHELSRYATYDPEHYIMVAFTNNNHYDLVHYKDKKILTFKEIPYDMKTIILKKCVEKNNEKSIFGNIPEFKQLRNEMNITETIVNEEPKTHLYDPSIVLSFHAQSDKTKKPGMVEADDIPVKRRPEFAALHKEHKLWRRKLDDSWEEAPFITDDGKKWASVYHYMTALRFRDSQPDIYNDLSMDANSDLSTNVEKVKLATENKKGKYYKEFKNTRAIDDDSYNTYRKNALRLKFNNPEYKRLLKDTLFAKLIIKKRGHPPFTDILLMEIREEKNNDV